VPPWVIAPPARQVMAVALDREMPEASAAPTYISPTPRGAPKIEARPTNQPEKQAARAPAYCFAGAARPHLLATHAIV